jgi:hypothetical protein
VNAHEYRHSRSRDCCGIIGRGDDDYKRYLHPRGKLEDVELVQCAGYRLQFSSSGRPIAFRCTRTVLRTKSTGSNTTAHTKCAVCNSSRVAHRYDTSTWRMKYGAAHALMAFLMPKSLCKSNCYFAYGTVWPREADEHML